MTRGKLIIFEGVEGAGKTTQLARAADSLRARGSDVITAREPGGTKIGERLREIILGRTDTALSPSAETLLCLAARSQLVGEVVAPALAADKIILLDRYVHSTLAYQGYGLGVDLGGGTAPENIRRLRHLCRWVVGDAWPDLVFLLDITVDVGAARNAAKKPDRIETRGAAFHRRVREGFLALAAEEPDVIKIIAADQAADAVFRDISAMLSTTLNI